MSTEDPLVIVGASLAGAKAAETLREEGFDGRVVLLGSESTRPYERPPLSKEYLRGEAGRDKVYVHDEGFYDAQSIELRLETTVEKVDPAASELTLAGGERLRYDKLLLATGSEPRRLAIPGAELDGVYYLRSVEDSDRLRERIDGGGRMVTIGGGWIGSEVAASARQRGLEVTVIDPGSVPLERVMGPEVGAIYRDLHVGHGVEMLLGTGVESLEGGGRVERVRTSDGRVVECDFVVAGIGAIPRTGLVASTAIAIDNGVLTDAKLETSVPGVFAAGDIANALHPFYGRLRVEHWSNALNQGPAAARAMLGKDVSYDRAPYFFSDQYDLGMEYRGFAREWDEVVFRGDRGAGEFIAFWITDGVVQAAMNANVWDAGDDIEALIELRRPVDTAALQDSGVALSDIVSKAANGDGS